MPYQPLKKGPKKELLKALRANYLQCDSALWRSFHGEAITDARRNGMELDRDATYDTFCCLGVATNLMVEKGLLSWSDVAVAGATDAHAEWMAHSHTDRRQFRVNCRVSSAIDL